MIALLLVAALASPPATACPPGQMLIGRDAKGKARCGGWKGLQARSRTGGGAAIRLPKGAVKRPAPGTWVIPRAAVSALIAGGLGRLSGQARLEPEYAGGARTGFRISRLKAGSLFESLGLRNGDLLIDINGVDLGRPAAVLGLYTLLFKPNAQATLRLRRGKAPVRLIWRIEG